MAKIRTISILTLVMILAFSNTAFSVSKVAARWYTLDIYSGSSTATGNYGGFRSEKWVNLFTTTGPNPSVAAADIYNSTYHIGLNYGNLRNDHIFYSLGFRYTKVKMNDSIIVRFNQGVGTLFPVFDVNLYDINFNLNYYLSNLTKSDWSPYFGIGFASGLEVFSVDGIDTTSGLKFESETEIKFALALNFGADFKLWSSKDNRNHLAVSSNNSFEFVGTGNRPKYFNFGLALRLYFRP